MSHPGAISWRCSRRISRMRRRIRFRKTAPPCASFTLSPNRLRSSPLARPKMTNEGLVCRRPCLYTTSNSERRTRRTARGKPSRGLDGRKAMASLLAACRQNFSSAHGLHARAEAVCLVPAAHFGLKGAFSQLSLSCSNRFHRAPAIPQAVPPCQLTDKRRRRCSDAQRTHSVRPNEHKRNK